MDRIFLILYLVLAFVGAQNVTPSNWTSENAAQHDDNAVGLAISVGEKMVQVGNVLGLTSKAKNGIPPTGLSGPTLLTSSSNQANLQRGQIAMISCDPSGTWIGPTGVLSAAANANVKAVVFYSHIGNWCNLTGYDDSFQWIYSMKSRQDTAEMLKDVSTQDPNNNNGQVYAAIGFPAALRVINNTEPDSNGGSTHSSSRDQNNNPLGPSPSTAVAMIILYSITGLITALFLIIIVTGALRAHRHPERYGPRNIMGRPRQSRARGLARAMLDTLPIVKFGEREEPKPGDVELAENTNSNTEDTAREATAGDETTSPTQQTTTSPTETTQQQTQNRASAEGGIAAAINDSNSQTENPDNKGCSICTEDFEAGQDQRVLPCDHRFHPACIDPWLLNVSGTCPLCRIDLRPQSVEGGEGETANETDENGNPVLREGQFAPPLVADETPNERERRSVRRSIMLGIMGIGRPDRLTREERVLALRRLRGERLARQRREEQAAVAETPEEESSTRRRLRSMFNVRTRRAGGEPSTTSGEASTSQAPESRESPPAPES